ncbi:proteinaceous RNase P 1, chloroplastic/mitochondrial-like protein [Cinnamomum micranthum f. kanehirae]|uniref:ribonuclease P n=1 Tax=Cinnamomum micranthum f. kanehirae TaxID=337451 RepID=A0A443PHJ9_9MAGN|nr:proteinaceous RNase P 1, chloroplastic/mitochondrial-like protein [Cinnamomum micranthum f. kanehirae]
MLTTSFLPHSRLSSSSSFISFFSKNPSTFPHQTLSHGFSSSSSSSKTLSMHKTKTLHLSSTVPSPPISKKSDLSKSEKRKRRELPENQLRHKLDICSKHGNLEEALRLYDEALSTGIPLSQHHYNVLLYLCSSSSASDVGLKRGFEIFRQMGGDQIPPNEATFTSMARLAAAMDDPDMAFDLVKKMLNYSIPPRLRSYGPALFGFCEKGEVEKAYEVDAHMATFGVVAEEPELAALLRASANSSMGHKVYQLLHRLRATVRRVSEPTAEIVEEWFGSEAAAEVGEVGWDMERVKEGVVDGGGGWHGQGWLGKGKWRVVRAHMDESGVCSSCGEKLVCIDIDPLETENFASSLSNLACQKELNADFTKFQEWLVHHGPFEAVIDGANMGLYNQQHFNFFQLNSVVKGIQQMSPSKKLPLIVLHTRRVRGGPAENPKNKKLLEYWRRSGVLYTTPTGSNDDWYWLYAAVSCKCLLVTDDEMRDHLFELLGTSFFPRWKEKHQVRVTFSKQLPPIFHMPPPYSIVIQESEAGSWHVPIVSGDDIETNRQWICATRAPLTVYAQSQPH